MARPTKEEAAAKAEGRKAKYVKEDFEPKTADQKYLAGGKTPAERAAHYQKHNSLTRTKKLSPARLAQLQKEESNLHTILQHDSVKKITREMHGYAGVSSPAMRAESSRPSSGPPPIHEGYNSRMPTKHKGKVFFGGKPGKELPITKASPMAAPKPEKAATPAAKPSAPVSKTVDQVADSQARKTTRAAAKPKSSGLGGTVAKATARARAKNTTEASIAGLTHKEETVQTSRHSPKAPMTDHMQPQQFGGLARAAGHGRIGKQSVSSTGYAGKHRGTYNAAEDSRRTALSGSISYGKHSAEGQAMYNKPKVRGWFEPGAKIHSETPLPASQKSIDDKIRELGREVRARQGWK